MQIRTLNDGINGNQQYYFYHDDTRDYNTSNHSDTYISDASGTSIKHWTFDNTTGLQGNLYEHSLPSWGYMRTTDIYWATDSDGNRYIGQSFVNIDPGQATQQTARTDQVRDNFGNLIQMKVYAYNNTSTPVRTYNNTYYSLGNYINNRLATSTVTPAGGSAITLATNYYDQPNNNGTNGSCGLWSYNFYAGTPNTAREFDPTYNGNTARGNLTFASTPGSVRCMAYDNAGLVLQTKDASGHVVTTTPDSSHNYSVPSAITTGNLTSTMQWNGAFDPTSATSPNGATSGMNYDAFGRPSFTTSPYGVTTGIAYSYSPPTKTVTTKNRFAKSTFDGFGREVKAETGYTTAASGSTPASTTTLSVTETQYAPCGCTPMGKMKQVSVPHAPGAATYWTVYNYDAIGRTVSVVQPNNSGTTQYLYSANTVKVTDPAGAWKIFTTDATGNLTQVTEPNPAGGTFLTYYTYSALNQLITVSMPRPSIPGGGTVTQTRSFVYDGNQRLQSVTNPESGTTSYTYNSDGTMATKTDAKNQVISYFYDTMGRLAQVKNGNVILRTLTYDANPDDQGNNYGTYLLGRLARIDYGVGNSAPAAAGNAWTELYSYDQAGGMLKKKLTLGRAELHPGSLEATLTYDDEGRMTSIKYPDFQYDPATGSGPTGPTYTYSYDQMGRPLTLTGGAYVSGVTYGPAGELTSINGETRTYNEQKQLTGINVPGLGSITYSFSSTNNNGRITGMTNTITGESVTYAYDSLNRLISASAGGQWGLSFSYDGFGNRLSQNVTAGSAPTIQQSYDMTTNRLQGQYYDANGNMGGISWDVENRLLQIQGQTAPYSTDTYDYGIDNKRIYKQTYLQSGNPEEVYFYVAGRKIATYTLAYLDITGDGYPTILFTQPKYNVYFGSRLMIANGQNVVLDRLGSVVWDGAPHSYFPYGEERTPTANNKDKFATYFRDASTGLDYADQRFYSSISGRFASADPYQASGGSTDPNSWNRYANVLSDPINFNDPEGLVAKAVEQQEDPERINHAAGGATAFYWWYWGQSGSGGGGSGSGSGGGGAGGGGEVISFTNTWLGKAQNAIANMSKGCADAIGAKYNLSNGPDSLLAKVTPQYSNAVVFIDGTLSEIRNKPMYEWGYKNSLSTGQFLGMIAQAFVAVQYDASGKAHAGNQIVLGPSAQNASPADRSLILIHEVLHSYTGLSDVDLANKLGLGDFGVDNFKASSTIANYLNGGCSSSMLAKP